MSHGDEGDDQGRRPRSDADDGGGNPVERGDLADRVQKVVDADAAVVAGDEPPSARLPLDRMRIVGAAIAFIDEFGLPGLSMRRLGSILGVEAMSLYRYVPGRENLLDAVVETILDEMRADEEASPAIGIVQMWLFRASAVIATCRPSRLIATSSGTTCSMNARSETSKTAPSRLLLVSSGQNSRNRSSLRA